MYFRSTFWSLVSTKTKKKRHLHIETISVNLMNTGRLLPSTVSKLSKIEKTLMKIRESFRTIVRKSARLVHVVTKIKSFWKKTSMIIEKNSCFNLIQFQRIVIVTSNIVKKRWEKRICHWSNRLSKATNQSVTTLKMWI